MEQYGKQHKQKNQHQCEFEQNPAIAPSAAGLEQQGHLSCHGFQHRCFPLTKIKQGTGNIFPVPWSVLW
jgi:hypothetical protein